MDFGSTIHLQNLCNLLDFVLASLDDDMGSRINEHEQSIDEIGVQGTPPSASKSDDEPKTPGGSS